MWVHTDLAAQGTLFTQRGRWAHGDNCLRFLAALQALLQSSHMYAEAQHSFSKHGVLVDGVTVDVAAMQQQKGSAVEGLTKGI